MTADRRASFRIPYQGAMERNGPQYTPHSMAFPSAFCSLKALYGLPLRQHEMQAHGRSWRSNDDYCLHAVLSGEAFGIMFDAAEYLRFSHPWGALSLKSCFDFEDIPVTMLAGKEAPAIDHIWQNEDELRSLVLDHLRSGLPVVLSGRPLDEVVLLAVGYEEDGHILCAWTFAPGQDITNKSFAPADCQYIANWWQGLDLVMLPQEPQSTEPAPLHKETILRTALKRGLQLLQYPSLLHRPNANYYQEWRQTMRSALMHDHQEIPLYPDLFDLAERRWSASFMLFQFKDGLTPHPDALEEAAKSCLHLHDLTWQVHALCHDNRCDPLHDPEKQQCFFQLLEEIEAEDAIIAKWLAQGLDT